MLQVTPQQAIKKTSTNIFDDVKKCSFENASSNRKETIPHERAYEMAITFEQDTCKNFDLNRSITTSSITSDQSSSSDLSIDLSPNEIEQKNYLKKIRNYSLKSIIANTKSNITSNAFNSKIKETLMKIKKKLTIAPTLSFRRPNHGKNEYSSSKTKNEMLSTITNFGYDQNGQEVSFSKKLKNKQ